MVKLLLQAKSLHVGGRREIKSRTVLASCESKSPPFEIFGPIINITASPHSKTCDVQKQAADFVKSKKEDRTFQPS